MIAHSIATRAVQTAARSPRECQGSLDTHEFEGIHEVQVGDLENRNDEAAHDEFNAVYRRWHEGELDVALPGGETGRCRCSTATCRCSTSCGCATSTTHAFGRRHRRRQPRRGDPAGLGGAGRRGRRLRHRPPPGEHRIGGAGADHRRPLELRAVGDADPAVRPGPTVDERSGTGPAVSRPDGLRRGQVDLVAHAADGTAVDVQCVRAVRGRGSRPRCTRTAVGVVDERAVAVLQPCHGRHGTHWSCPVHSTERATTFGLPRGRLTNPSAPAQFVQAVVVDAEVVRDLVDHRDGDLVDDLGLGVADVQQGLAVDRDGVRQRAARTRSRARSARCPRRDRAGPARRRCGRPPG